MSIKFFKDEIKKSLDRRQEVEASLLELVNTVKKSRIGAKRGQNKEGAKPGFLNEVLNYHAKMGVPIFGTRPIKNPNDLDKYKNRQNINALSGKFRRYELGSESILGQIEEYHSSGEIPDWKNVTLGTSMSILDFIYVLGFMKNKVQLCLEIIFGKKEIATLSPKEIIQTNFLKNKKPYDLLVEIYSHDYIEKLNLDPAAINKLKGNSEGN